MFLSIDDLLANRLAHILKEHRRIRCGGGPSNHNNTESKIVHVRKSMLVKDLNQLPLLSTYDSYQVIPCNLQNTVVRDIREFADVPSAAVCRKMLNVLSNYTGKGVACVKTSSGQIFSKNDVENIIKNEFNLLAKQEMRNEIKWLGEISDGKTLCPDGLSAQANLKYVENAVSFLHRDEVSDNCSFHGLPYDSVKGMMKNTYYDG